MLTRPTIVANPEPGTAPLPLPIGMRALLLAILTAGYPSGAAQTRLSNAPDGAIAWQCQSMLDDYADHDALRAFHAFEGTASSTSAHSRSVNEVLR
jgi:hypothetical protein